jgi:hypothetical protein
VPPWTRADGTVVQGRWRATHVDLDGKIERVSGTTTALAESVRDGLVTALARRASPTNSRFSITTKTRCAQGVHHLQLRAHRAQQATERLTLGSAWRCRTSGSDDDRRVRRTVLITMS